MSKRTQRETEDIVDIGELERKLAKAQSLFVSLNDKILEVFHPKEPPPRIARALKKIREIL